VLYLFDGSNLLHAGAFRDRDELIDRLASFIALEGARGVVVFDGVGEERTLGSLEVRFARHADDVLERFAAERRGLEPVFVVSSDRAVRTTAGQATRRVSASAFLRDLAQQPSEPGAPRSTVEEALDEETRERLERWRRRRH
jgi:predicted RNA-binding protein with PIN domain